MSTEEPGGTRGAGGGGGGVGIAGTGKDWAPPQVGSLGSLGDKGGRGLDKSSISMSLALGGLPAIESEGESG